MISNIRKKVLLAIAGLAIPLLAVAEQRLNWDDLAVTVHPSEDPFFGLAFEQKSSLEIVLQAVEFREKGEKISAELAELEANSRDLLEQSDYDVELLIRQEADFRRKIRNQAVDIRGDLDGSKIRIPGYVVPVGFDGLLIREFLLVPYAGACIHTPPPPPSQIIHVNLEQGFEIGDLYTPVWVSGELKAKLTRHAADLTDGTSSFDVGYQIGAGSVEPYH